MNPLNHYNKIRLEDKGITCRTAAPHTVSHTILASGNKEKNRRQGNCARNDERKKKMFWSLSDTRSSWHRQICDGRKSKETKQTEITD